MPLTYCNIIVSYRCALYACKPGAVCRLVRGTHSKVETFNNIYKIVVKYCGARVLGEYITSVNDCYYIAAVYGCFLYVL